MEIAVPAPVAGRVRDVYVARNVQVAAGAALFRIEPADRWRRESDGQRIGARPARRARPGARRRGAGVPARLRRRRGRGPRCARRWWLPRPNCSTSSPTWPASPPSCATRAPTTTAHRASTWRRSCARATSSGRGCPPGSARPWRGPSPTTTSRRWTRRRRSRTSLLRIFVSEQRRREQLPIVLALLDEVAARPGADDDLGLRESLGPRDRAHTAALPGGRRPGAQRALPAVRPSARRALAGRDVGPHAAPRGRARRSRARPGSSSTSSSAARCRSCRSSPPTASSAPRRRRRCSSRCSCAATTRSASWRPSSPAPTAWCGPRTAATTARSTCWRRASTTTTSAPRSPRSPRRPPASPRRTRSSPTSSSPGLPARRPTATCSPPGSAVRSHGADCRSSCAASRSSRRTPTPAPTC